MPFELELALIGVRVGYAFSGQALGRAVAQSLRS